MISVNNSKILQIGIHLLRKCCTTKARSFRYSSSFGIFDTVNSFQYADLSIFCQKKKYEIISGYPICKLCTSSHRKKELIDLEPTEKELQPRKQFFEQMDVKDKSTFLLAIKIAKENERMSRGQVEFIYAALKCMEEYGIESDLESYKKLLDVFPKGKMIPRNLIQAEFYHFPRQQECAIHLLAQMESFAVCPDQEMKELILNIFGMSSQVFKKYARMLYWLPKLRNISPYILPDPMPSAAEELATLALKRMAVDQRTKITHFKAEDLEDSIDNTWIVSAQSPDQMKLIDSHVIHQPLYVEGSFLVWLNKVSISYFYLRAAAKVYPKYEEDPDDLSNLPLYVVGGPKPAKLVVSPSTVHEQEDGVIMAMCATGTSSKDSLLSWIRFLQQNNPKLSEIPVVFKICSPPTALSTVNFTVCDKTSKPEGGLKESETWKS